jgi:hypothetical protein
MRKKRDRRITGAGTTVEVIRGRRRSAASRFVEIEERRGPRSYEEEYQENGFVKIVGFRGEARFAFDLLGELTAAGLEALASAIAAGRQPTDAEVRGWMTPSARRAELARSGLRVAK